MSNKIGLTTIGKAKVSPLDPTNAWDILKVSQNYQELPINIGNEPKKEGMIRFVCISDTHGMHSKIPNIPEGDVLIHAGDITNVGEPSQFRSFDEWIGNLPHKYKVVIAGNHDTTIQKGFSETHPRYRHTAAQAAEAQEILQKTKNFIYLEDQSVNILGYNIFGSPWQPEFCDWAFNLDRGTPCRLAWEKIPTETEILITHGPPVGYGDRCASGHRAGCVDLLATIQERVNPLYHISGHIHEGYGVKADGLTTYINASTCTFNYRPTNPPIVFDLPKKS
eukprot:c980_g1_i1.p1 GENE.c980_g1_i1~~c980_g1_i1.p1  ORF type:complete len:290 (+),score=104.97 c980_g1_i1:36-872(+)